MYESLDLSPPCGGYRRAPEVCFETHLMWMPMEDGAEPPAMNWEEVLKGVDFCIAHPVYNSESLGLEVVFEEC